MKSKALQKQVDKLTEADKKFTAGLYQVTTEDGSLEYFNLITHRLVKHVKLDDTVEEFYEDNGKRQTVLSNSF
ncbi:MAG: hypothetical protein Q8807_02220 ['Waltheria sp.' little leaf phytoplasma]|nr:hypothetical protein ['Waltheria sp.' little leaf phytoplasma]